MDYPHPDQLILPLDWGKEPWSGVSPRYVTRGIRDRLRLWITRSTLPEPARADGFYPDPAQLNLYIHGESDGS